MPKIQNTLFVSKRGPHGVGKQMIGCKYVHISAIDAIPTQERELVEKARSIFGPLPTDIDIIVKICLKEGRVSFIESPDWNISSEPSIGKIKGVKGLFTDKPGLYKRDTLEDPQIYHHKWMFVKDDYRGFDVENFEQGARSADIDYQFGQASYFQGR